MYRTPAKPSTANDDLNITVTLAESEAENGSSTSSGVKQSIGKWETRKPDQSQSSLTPSRLSPAFKTAPLKPNPAVRRLSAEMTVSPPKPVSSKMNDRLTEARSWLLKAKQHLSNSRNIKSEIKAGVLEAVERLYQIIRETNNIKKQGPTKQYEEKRGEETADENLKENFDKDRNKELEKKIERHMELLKENNDKMEQLRESLERKTYASVAAAAPRRQPAEYSALHSVVVTAKDNTETGEEVLSRIRKAVNAKEGGVHVEKVRKAKDRKIIIGCRTEQERQNVKEKLKKTDELNVEDIKNKDPLVILKDVLQLNSDEEVLRALRNQNGSIFKVDEEEDRVQIAYKRKARNPHTTHIVLRVSPQIWQRMTDAGSVHIDLQRVRVEDQSPLVQCSMCLGYGHGRRFCTDTLEKCSHCGGPHMKATCPDWQAGLTPSCCNCVHAKLDKTDHNAFSNECAIRRKWEALARASVAYC